MFELPSRLLTKVLLAGSLLSSSASAQPARPDPFVFIEDRDDKGASGEGLAWWLLESKIRPTGKSVSGVTLDRLTKAADDPTSTWCYATAFTPASFVSASRRVQAEIEETFRKHQGALFRATAAFTGAAVQDAVVGNYETCEGAVGAFILITDRAPLTRGIVHLKTFPDWQGLIWIEHEGDALRLSSCFECGHVDRIYYDKGRRQFYMRSEGD
jgi:hypothetical protein